MMRIHIDIEDSEDVNELFEMLLLAADHITEIIDLVRDD